MQGIFSVYSNEYIQEKYEGELKSLKDKKFLEDNAKRLLAQTQKRQSSPIDQEIEDTINNIFRKLD
jgi:hypothetical protein